MSRFGLAEGEHNDAGGDQQRASQWMSKARMRVTRLVPTLPPSIIACAIAEFMKPLAANDAVIRAVAVLLCSAIVTARPTANAMIRFRVPAAIQGAGARRRRGKAEALQRQRDQAFCCYPFARAVSSPPQFIYERPNLCICPRPGDIPPQPKIVGARLILFNRRSAAIAYRTDLSRLHA